MQCFRKNNSGFQSMLLIKFPLHSIFYQIALFKVSNQYGYNTFWPAHFLTLHTHWCSALINYLYYETDTLLEEKKLKKTENEANLR